jgi:hypothetical protein
MVILNRACDRRMSHAARNIFVTCHELAGFYTNIQMHIIFTYEPALSLPPIRQNVYSLICWRERRWWCWAIRHNAILIHHGGKVTILVLSFWCLSSKSGLLKTLMRRAISCLRANKKSHFVASHQKCWRHVRAMVDCQKISLVNQIAALVRHATCDVARPAKNDWDTSQKFRIWGFCQNFLQKYCDSLVRDSTSCTSREFIFGNVTIRFVCFSMHPRHTQDGFKSARHVDNKPYFIDVKHV